MNCTYELTGALIMANLAHYSKPSYPFVSINSWQLIDQECFFRLLKK